MKGFTFRIPFISLLVLVLVVISACGSGNSGSPTGSNNNGGSTPESGSNNSNNSNAEAITFSMGHIGPPVHVQDLRAMTPFSEEVTELTEGRVNFQIYPGSALGSPVETYDNIITGIMDAGWSLQGYNAGVFPVHSVLHLPFLANGTATELSVIAHKLYEQFPEIQEEYSDVKLLWVHAADSYAIITKGKAVRTFEDVKGLKLRTPSTEAGKMIESWGATPVSMPAPEIYDAMQKGVIDGGVLPIAAIKDFNLYDVVDYVSVGYFNTSLFYMLMNKDSWDKISAEDQAIIEELIGEPMARKAGEAFDYQQQEAQKESLEAGIEFIELEESELQKFKDASQGVTEEWLSAMEGKGVDGQAIYDAVIELLEK